MKKINIDTKVLDIYGKEIIQQGKKEPETIKDLFILALRISIISSDNENLLYRLLKKVAQGSGEINIEQKEIELLEGVFTTNQAKIKNANGQTEIISIVTREERGFIKDYLEIVKNTPEGAK